MKAKVAAFIAIILFSVLGILALHLIEKYGFINTSGIREMSIAENVEFNEDWKEIDLGKVDLPRKEYNAVLIYSQLPAEREGFVAPDGKVFYPEAMLEDHQGNKCSLKFTGGMPLNSLRFTWEAIDSTEEKCFSRLNAYQRLWIKSPVRFNARKVIWEGYDLSDRK